MDEETRRLNFGSVLMGLGIAIFAAVLVAAYFGRAIPFFGENLFLVILMIIVGRAISRRARAKSAESLPAPPTPRPRRPTPPPPPTRPPATSRPAPSPTSQTDTETPGLSEPPKPTTAHPAQERDERMPPVIGPRPIRARTMASGHNLKTSEEMIAEAKERLGRKRG